MLSVPSEFRLREGMRDEIARNSVDAEIEFSSYQVIESETHKYASTHVSEFNNQISSSTSFHSDQTLWGKNLETSIEEQLIFDKANVPARPGHIVALAWNKVLGKYELVKNLTMNKAWYLDTRGSIHSKLDQKTTVLWMFACAFFAAIPYLGTLPHLAITMYIMRSNGGIIHDTSGVHKKLYCIALILTQLVYLIILFFWQPNYRGEYTNFWWVYLLAVVVIGSIQLAIANDEKQQVIKRGKYFEECFNRYVESLPIEDSMKRRA